VNICLYRDSNPPPVIALAVRFIFPHAASGTEELVLTVNINNLVLLIKIDDKLGIRVMQIQEDRTKSSINFEHTVVPDVVGHVFCLVAPRVELMENGFHWTV
jgi:hypothetical protein